MRGALAPLPTHPHEVCLIKNKDNFIFKLSIVIFIRPTIIIVTSVLLRK
jgi:hypothetical protein